MSALLIANDNSTCIFERSDLSETPSEKWLQELLFGEPGLLPLEQFDPGAGHFIPICQELGLSNSGKMDIFGLTQAGRPVLIECKLWRNPQARREVVAQVLEYAALLRRWSYADLTARLKAKLDWCGHNPLYDHAVKHGCALGEAFFSDVVARNLRNGDFHLFIVGDGIREDMSAIAEHIGDKGAHLALVEFQRWKDQAGNLLIVPHVPFRTEVVRQRIILDATGSSVRIEDEQDDEAEDTELDPEKAATKKANRAFWQSFIDRADFDHPDQTNPVPSGNNGVKIDLPRPAKWIIASRYEGKATISLKEEKGTGLFEFLRGKKAELQSEFGPEELFLNWANNKPAFAVEQPENVVGDPAQLEWLLDASNRFVNLLRPLLGEDI